jgi:hypothetical protein
MHTECCKECDQAHFSSREGRGVGCESGWAGTSLALIPPPAVTVAS